TILLGDQDRSAWDRPMIEEGLGHAARAMASPRAGPFALKAGIAAVHASAGSAGETDWGRIAALYDRLIALEPTAIVALNRAVAIAERDGPAAGLAIIDELLAEGQLEGYHLAHSARGELLRRLGQVGDARAAYSRALELARQADDRRFLSRRLAELQHGEHVGQTATKISGSCVTPARNRQ